ncbi:hypothetical protein EYS42_11430 [Aquabacterium lacunae]|uniref:Polymerase n=1 Tax=Aquabacterium lacunae TaxID=2528630 RepID=A0A4Q9GY04_9BURK|nr:O-antigen ligase family protein [Aquabacterium lacunae]TBO30296.1 hypothetical protein EYS42_11430 [Aquabacterium lacunae]
MHPFTFSFARLTSPWQLRLWPWFLAAVLLPTLLAPSDPPMITFYNQILSVAGWGACVWALGRAGAQQLVAPGSPVARLRSKGLVGLSVALLVCMTAAGVSMVWRGLAEGLALMAMGSMACALVLLHVLFRTSQERGASTVMDLLARALVLTVAVAVLLSFIQVFLPSVPDGRLLAIPTMAGRAVANLRQPNHLATMLVLGSMAAVWVARRGQWSVLATATLVALAMGGVVMTASRTGMVGSALLLVWALRDRRMPAALRLAAASAPLWYAAWWAFMYWWSHAAEGHAFAAAARLGDGSDISSSRFAIWANVLQLVAQHPWTGVGWGEFNVAWTFTAFPGRPTAFFDHTHNIVLQWLVELGLPMAAVVIVGVVLAFWALWQQWGLPPEGDVEAAERHSLVCLSGSLVAMAGLHSLLEYPLWYTYFLLPTAAAWAVGLAAAAGAPLEVVPPAGTHQVPSGVAFADWRAVAGAAMAAGAVWCALDYQWAVNVYAPRYGHAPLNDRIESARKRLWFGYQADYAHVNGPDLDEAPRPVHDFSRTLHNIVDTRLMVAYARALHAEGQLDKARYVVARLREFKPPRSNAFLKPCFQPEPGQPLAWQCQPPERSYHWRELMPDQAGVR